MISKYSQIKSLYPKKKKKIEHIKLKQCVNMQVSKYVIRKIDTCTSNITKFIGRHHVQLFLYFGLHSFQLKLYVNMIFSIRDN
jgi:hypothetical protein